MSFTVQDRAIDPTTGRQFSNNPNDGMARVQARKEFDDRLKATRSKFLNVPNSQAQGRLIENDLENENKMTMEKFRSVTPAQAQMLASGKDTAQQVRSRDDERAKFYQNQNAPQSTLHENTLSEPTKPPEVAGDGSMSERLALLARKEKAFSSKMLDLKAQEEKFKAREAEIQSSYIPKQKLVDDPFSVLKDNGLSYDQLTEKLLAQQNGQDPMILDLQSQIKELRDLLSEQKSTVENKEKQSYEQAVEVQRKAVKSLVESDSQFELINATNSHEDVVDMIVKTFKDENVLLSPMEAAQKIEASLMEEAFKLASVNKIKAKLGMPSENLSQAKEVAPKETSTLTNRMQTDSFLPPVKKVRNWQDWRRQAIQTIQNRQDAGR